MFKHFVKLTANAAPIKLLLLSGAFIVCSYYTVGFLCFVSALHSRSSSVYSETLQAFRLCLFRSFQCPLTILACSFFSPPPSLSGCVFFPPLCVSLTLICSVLWRSPATSLARVRGGRRRRRKRPDWFTEDSSAWIHTPLLFFSYFRSSSSSSLSLSLCPPPLSIHTVVLQEQEAEY